MVLDVIVCKILNGVGVQNIIGALYFILAFCKLICKYGFWAHQRPIQQPHSSQSFKLLTINCDLIIMAHSEDIIKYFMT